MKKPFTPVISSLLLGTTLLQSCATIISSPSQSVRVVGQPAGSTYYVNERIVKAKPIAGSTDVIIKVKRKKNSEVKIKHDGYKDYSEVLYPDKKNALIYLNWVPVLGGIGSAFRTNADGTPAESYSGTGLLVGLGGFAVDKITGSDKRLNKSEIKPDMIMLPKAVAGSQTVQCGLMNVRIKGGDKMGNFMIRDEPAEILYFGKSLDVDVEHLKATVNGSLKDLGYTVPTSEGKSVFSTGANSRYTLQGEMRDIKYNIKATNKYEHLAHYETSCAVEITWKLVNQNRQTVFEKKTAGSSFKFERGGSASFEDAFENSLYTFMGNKEVAAALAKPAGNSAATAAADEKLPAIAIHRAAALKLTGDNGVGSAAKCVVTIETTDGHGSGCIISADGYLVTNAHVVGEEETVKVRMADGIEAKGKVVRVNPDMDLALVKIDVDGLSAFLLPSAASADLGADVFAIGTPADKELGQSITKGIISGRRKIEGHSFLQTDVSINGGNSGGALVGRSGQLVGIVNAKLVGRGIEGIGFAIPAEQVSDALQLKFVD
ncbi:S1C family serine protease [Hymenobacter cellulosilyticus]|uniref:Trypsin-like peptidase domain-containing protein n=1 Tax=Hymenobacter cellulosilyticus TaxID=2932248 RepID=A0A8T9Q7J1_9BACT|nr:trypsin-like peptidase domain-containing protein [Hymenobacter cellulosilyticus]UOQ71750.1 trypsin-like peptidase domain-containing protein [Hymenobacter cellulosilyticus]